MKKQDKHHWSGWPGAFCLKCFSEDPIEMALAAGDAFFEDEAGENPQLKFKTPEIEQEIIKASYCLIKGELVWNYKTERWDLITS